MLLGWMVTVCCLASSVLGAEDGVRKKLVRRRKGGDWVEGEAASARSSAPVKRVFKRKIVKTGSGEAAVVRRKMVPHLLPEQQRLQHQPPLIRVQSVLNLEQYHHHSVMLGYYQLSQCSPMMGAQKNHQYVIFWHRILC